MLNVKVYESESSRRKRIIININRIFVCAGVWQCAACTCRVAAAVPGRVLPPCARAHAAAAHPRAQVPAAYLLHQTVPQR